MESPANPPKASGLRAALLGGLIPVLVFTFVEEYYGTLWGLIAGMVFGVGELIWEKVKQGKIDKITWLGNGLILVLGGVSLFTQEGVWFKLQPSILESVMGVLCVGSVLLGKPFLTAMATKQGTLRHAPESVRPLLEAQFKGLTLRFGIFFLLHAALAAYAAFYWSTRAWMILKGVGFTVSLLVYGLIEVLFMRRRMARQAALQRREE